MFNVTQSSGCDRLNCSLLVSFDVTAASPPDIEAPTELKRMPDGSVLLRLMPALDHTAIRYFVIVVTEDLARKKNPGDFKIDEVYVFLFSMKKLPEIKVIVDNYGVHWLTVSYR
jgi:hypothetical protein